MEPVRRRDKELIGFFDGKACNLRRFKPGADHVAAFNLFLERRGRRRREAETPVHRFIQPRFDLFIVPAQHRFEGADHIAHYIFRRIMQQRRHPVMGRRFGIKLLKQVQHYNTVLCDGKGMIARRLPIPARNSRKTARNIFDLYVQRRWIQQIKAASGQHALPGAGRFGAGGHKASLANIGVERKACVFLTRFLEALMKLRRRLEGVRMRHFLNAVAITGLAACTADVPLDPDTVTDATSEVCAIDHDARIDWADWNRSDDAVGTATFVYTGCDKRLVFIAAEHTNDPDSETFAAIRMAVADAPDFILIEGVPAARGVNLPALIDYANSVEGSPSDNEAMFATRLAVDRGVDVMGAEPDDTEVIAYAATQDINSLDVIGYYVLRQLPQMMQSGEVTGTDDPRLEEMIPNLVSYFAKETGLSPSDVSDIDTLPEFSVWYASLNGGPFKDSSPSYDASPSSNVPDPKPSNYISDTIADARDAFILERIETALSDYDNVLIIYGGSHQTVQDPALRAAFGAPERIR